MPVIAGKEGLRVGAPGERGALFHALPADTRPPPPAVTPQYPYTQKNGSGRAYSVAGEPAMPGYEGAGQPVCLVWRGPAGPRARGPCLLAQPFGIMGMGGCDAGQSGNAAGTLLPQYRVPQPAA